MPTKAAARRKKKRNKKKKEPSLSRVGSGSANGDAASLRDDSQGPEPSQEAISHVWNDSNITTPSLVNLPMSFQIEDEEDKVPTTNRQKELFARRDQLGLLERVNALSLYHIGEYEVLIQKIVRRMTADKDQIWRRYRLAEAKLKLARDARRQQQINDELAMLKRRERVYNLDVAAVNKEMNRFHKTAAFSLARKQVSENYQRRGGTLVAKTNLYSKKDEVDFDQLLAQMKKESTSST